MPLPLTNIRRLRNRSYRIVAVQFRAVSTPTVLARLTAAPKLYLFSRWRTAASPSTRRLLTSVLPPVATKPADAPPETARGGWGRLSATVAATSIGPPARDASSPPAVFTTISSTTVSAVTSLHGIASAPWAVLKVNVPPSRATTVPEYRSPFFRRNSSANPWDGTRQSRTAAHSDDANRIRDLHENASRGKHAARHVGVDRSPLHEKSALPQEFAHTVPVIALKLHGVVGGRASGSARALQFATELFQERGVAREVVHDRHRLAA